MLVLATYRQHKQWSCLEGLASHSNQVLCGQSHNHILQLTYGEGWEGVMVEGTLSGFIQGWHLTVLQKKQNPGSPRYKLRYLVVPVWLTVGWSISVLGGPSINNLVRPWNQLKNRPKWANRNPCFLFRHKYKQIYIYIYIYISMV